MERRPRRVRIDSLEILKTELPEITFRVECSKGTYIRTLCDDIGRKLGCGGTMKSLKRTRVGRFEIAQARTLKELEALAGEGRLEEALIPVEELFAGCPRLMVKPEWERLVRNGNELFPEQVLRQDGAADRRENPADPGRASAASADPRGRASAASADPPGRASAETDPGWFRVCGPDGVFYGIYELCPERGEKGSYRPVKMFLT